MNQTQQRGDRLARRPGTSDDLSPTVRTLPPTVRTLPPTATTCHLLPRCDSFLSHAWWLTCGQNNESRRAPTAMSLAGLMLRHTGSRRRAELGSVANDLLLEKEGRDLPGPVTVCHIETSGLRARENSSGKCGEDVEETFGRAFRRGQETRAEQGRPAPNKGGVRRPAPNKGEPRRTRAEQGHCFSWEGEAPPSRDCRWMHNHRCGPAELRPPIRRPHWVLSLLSMNP